MLNEVLFSISDLNSMLCGCDEFAEAFILWQLTGGKPLIRAVAVIFVSVMLNLSIVPCYFDSSCCFFFLSHVICSSNKSTVISNVTIVYDQKQTSINYLRRFQIILDTE